MFNPELQIYCVGSNQQTIDISRFLLLHEFKARCFNCINDFSRCFLEHKPECLIIDTNIFGPEMMPLLKEIRKTFSGPLIVIGDLNSKNSWKGIPESGVDDFLDRTIEPLIILARLNAIRDRIQNSGKGAVEYIALEEGILTINTNTHQAELDGSELGLTLNEWRIFLYLVTHRKRSVSRKELLENALQYIFGGYNRILDSYIRNIRKKTGIPNCIATIRGFGYRFTMTEKEN